MILLTFNCTFGHLIYFLFYQVGDIYVFAFYAFARYEQISNLSTFSDADIGEI